LPLAGTQLTFGWALALCYYVGWRGHDLETAVAVMCAESARYPDSWHDNYIGVPPDELQLVSTDWGLFQINDLAHKLELPYHLEEIPNATYAHNIYKDHGKSFNAWAAYNSGAYMKFLPSVQAARELGRWRNKVPRVVKHFG